MIISIKMSSITPFTDSETKKVCNVLYNRLCESSFYEPHREIIRGKHNFDDLYKMFNEFIESVKYDTKLLTDFKVRYDYLMRETIGHMYIDHEAYLKWHGEPSTLSNRLLALSAFRLSKRLSHLHQTPPISLSLQCTCN